MKIAIDNIDFGYLNLDERHDRRHHAEIEFAKACINVHRQRGQLVTKANFIPDGKTLRMYNRTPGAIGCWRGQTAIIESAPANKIACVFEDDVCLCEDFKDRVAYLGDHVPDDWDIVFLGATFHVNPAVWNTAGVGRDAERISHRIFRTYAIWSTYAWLVNPESRMRVLELLDQNQHRSDGIDHATMLYLQPALKTYCMVPGCAWQFDNQSNIGNGITQFSNFKKLGPYVWSDCMDQFDPDAYNWAEAGSK